MQFICNCDDVNCCTDAAVNSEAGPSGEFFAAAAVNGILCCVKSSTVVFVSTAVNVISEPLLSINKQQ